MARKIERLYLTAISVHQGIIKVIMPNGEIALFAQRGLKKLSPSDVTVAIERGLLEPSAFGLQELPSNISISFEEPSIQGRAIASFNPKVLYDR